MSDRERWGTRDLTYSNWHRSDSIARFVGAATARTLTMIDLDAVEYCHRCQEPVGVIEVARDVGQAHKATTVTGNLARRLGVPGLLVFYQPSATHTLGVYPDIESFRVRLIAPVQQSERLLAPGDFAQWIKRLHDRCACRIDEAA